MEVEEFWVFLGVCGLLGSLLVVFGPLFEEDLFQVFFFLGFVEFGLGGYGSVEVVEGDFFYGFNGLGCLIGFGEVGGGDLEGVEEESGAAGVELVGGDALEEEAEGGLDGGAVLGQGEVEGGVGVGWLGGAGGWASGLVVVEAEGLVAEGSGAAAVAVGEDVAALVGGRGGGG